MEIGDKLYCHTKCIMRGSGISSTTVGKYYKVQDIQEYDNEFYIIDDQNDEHFFTIKNKNGVSNYRQFFYRYKELRKEKLKKLKSVCL